MVAYVIIFFFSFELVSHGETLVYPVVEARVSSGYGKRVHPIRKAVRHHSGVDLAAPSGSHVRSVRAGRVIYAGKLGSYGKLVSVEHENGYTTSYGHLSEFQVEVGQRVATGDVIGRVGETGLATGPHLHFEVRKDGKSLNPKRFLKGLGKPAQG